MNRLQILAWWAAFTCEAFAAGAALLLTHYADAFHNATFAGVIVIAARAAQDRAHLARAYRTVRTYEGEQLVAEVQS